MRNYLLHTLIFLSAGCLLLVGCDDYLDIKPKGKKVPSTLADYRAFLEASYVYTLGQNDRYLVNEFLFQPTSLNSYPLVKANYQWIEEGGDRISLTNTESAYEGNYKGVYFANLIINDVPSLKKSGQAEEDEANELEAQGKVLRALHYFNLINTFAKAYNAATADSDVGVPIITASDDFESVIPQKSVADCYRLMLDDLTSALPYLPETSKSFMQPDKAAGYALLARVQLFMKDFDNAFTNADEALKRRSYIFDMVAYHTTNIGKGASIQGGPSGKFSGLPRITYTLGKDENILMAHGNSMTELQGFLTSMIPMKDSVGGQNYVRDSSRFELGDTRFLCNFYRNTSMGVYAYQRRDDVNAGGIRTTEVYLMRAECYARKGELGKAMDDLNAIRRKRIINYPVPGLPANFTYKDLTASTITEAMDYIRHERDVELMGSGMMFYDLRRFNTEPAYRRTLVKVDHERIRRTLEPDSDLWIMPFPKTVTNYNSAIKQNTKF